MDTAASILWIASVAIFVFAVVYAISTVALIVLSLVEATLIKIERGELFSPPVRLRRPGISIIAAAYNTEPLIVANALSLLASDYDPLEVVIVDDGSEDGTTAALKRRFDLVELPVGDRLLIATAPIEQLYVSRTDPRLRVVRKANGGRSDAINAGLNIARNELVALVDADTLLEADALKRIVEVFAADPDDVVAVGGTIRIANGAVIENNVVTSPRVPHAGVEASQTCEYLRGFLGSRIAWSRAERLARHLRSLRRLPPRPSPHDRWAVQGDARRRHGARDAPPSSAAAHEAADTDRLRPRRDCLDGDPHQPGAASWAADPLARRPARQPPHPSADDRPPPLRRRRTARRSPTPSPSRCSGHSCRSRGTRSWSC